MQNQDNQKSTKHRLESEFPFRPWPKNSVNFPFWSLYFPASSFCDSNSVKQIAQSSPFSALGASTRRISPRRENDPILRVGFMGRIPLQNQDQLAIYRWNMIENRSSIVLFHHITICYFVIIVLPQELVLSRLRYLVWRNVVSNWDTTADIETTNFQTQHEANTRDIKWHCRQSNANTNAYSKPQDYC